MVLVMRASGGCILLLIAVAAAAGAMAAPQPSLGGPLPPAYLPLLSTQSITPNNPAGPASSSAAPAGASFQLTPSGCSGSACTGFRLVSDMAKRSNSVVFTPNKGEVTVEPWGSSLYEIGTLHLKNGGLMAPMGARMTLVPLTASATVLTPGVNKPAKLTLNFNVMWSLGSPAPANEAGLFVLSTRNPAPSVNFTLTMAPRVDFSMKFRVVGFKPDPKLGSSIEVLGDWGQTHLAAGQPGPRVYVRKGQTQVVKLVASICNTRSENNPSCSNTAG